jgi:hypothetical protein
MGGGSGARFFLSPRWDVILKHFQWMRTWYDIRGGGGTFDRRSTAERDNNRAARHEDDGVAQRAEGRGGNRMDMFAVL